MACGPRPEVAPQDAQRPAVPSRTPHSCLLQGSEGNALSLSSQGPCSLGPLQAPGLRQPLGSILTTRGQSWGPSYSLQARGDLSAPITAPLNSPSPLKTNFCSGILNSCSAHSCPCSLDPEGGQRPWEALGFAQPRATTGWLWGLEAHPCPSLDLSSCDHITRGFDPRGPVSLCS